MIGLNPITTTTEIATTTIRYKQQAKALCNNQASDYAVSNTKQHGKTYQNIKL